MQCLSLAVLSLNHPWATEAEVSDRQLGGRGVRIESPVEAMGEVRSLGGLCEWRERQTVISNFAPALGGDLHNPSSRVGCYLNHTLALWDLLKSFD